MNSERIFKQVVSEVTADVRSILRSSGLNRTTLARKADVSDAALSLFMHGKRGLKFSTLQRLCRVADVEIRFTMRNQNRTIRFHVAATPEAGEKLRRQLEKDLRPPLNIKTTLFNRTKLTPPRDGDKKMPAKATAKPCRRVSG